MENKSVYWAAWRVSCGGNSCHINNLLIEPELIDIVIQDIAVVFDARLFIIHTNKPDYGTYERNWLDLYL